MSLCEYKSGLKHLCYYYYVCCKYDTSRKKISSNLPGTSIKKSRTVFMKSIKKLIEFYYDISYFFKFLEFFETKDIKKHMNKHFIWSLKAQNVSMLCLHSVSGFLKKMPGSNVNICKISIKLPWKFLRISYQFPKTGYRSISQLLHRHLFRAGPTTPNLVTALGHQGADVPVTCGNLED